MARSRASHACRTFAWGLAAFLGLQVLLGIVTDIEAVPVRDPEYAFREEQLRAVRAAHPGRPSIVLLGTSRTMVGINAQRLSQAGGPVLYNFGMPAAGPARQLATWRRLVQRGLKPDAVAIEVLPALHTFHGQKIFESCWNDSARLSWNEAAELVPYYARPWRAAARWGLARLMPLTRYAPSAYRDYFSSSTPYAVATQEGIPTDAFGWRQGKSRHVTDAAHRAKCVESLLQQYARACADLRPAPAEPLFDQLLNEVRAAGVPAVCFVMPECDGFREQSAHLAAVHARVRHTCQQHGVSFVDAAAWMSDDAFWDGHHLHPETADAFTDRFATEILRKLRSESEPPSLVFR